MCTLEKNGNTFILKLTGEGENNEHRLGPSLISSIRSALSEAKSKSTHGSVFITVATGKYFCNGFDLNPTIFSTPSKNNALEKVLHMFAIFKLLITDFMSLPMPTIAIVTGHAVTAGAVFAMCHDYVFMRRDRGVLYMNEIEMGVTLPDYAVELVRCKVSKPIYRRNVLLSAVKMKADEAVEVGIVDSAYDSKESAIEGGVRFGQELGKRKFDGEVYAEIRKSLYPELCKMLGLGSKHLVKSSL